MSNGPSAIEESKSIEKVEGREILPNPEPLLAEFNNHLSDHSSSYASQSHSFAEQGDIDPTYPSFRFQS